MYMRAGQQSYLAYLLKQHSSVEVLVRRLSILLIKRSGSKWVETGSGTQWAV